MDEKNEKAAKKIFHGLRRLLNRIFLGQVEFGYKETPIGLKGGPCVEFLPTFFCGREHLVAKMGGNSPQNGQIHPKGAPQRSPPKGDIRGPN
jgi:hypothetical protein